MSANGTFGRSSHGRPGAARRMVISLAQLGPHLIALPFATGVAFTPDVAPRSAPRSSSRSPARATHGCHTSRCHDRNCSSVVAPPGVRGASATGSRLRYGRRRPTPHAVARVRYIGSHSIRSVPARDGPGVTRRWQIRRRDSGGSLMPASQPPRGRRLELAVAPHRRQAPGTTTSPPPPTSHPRPCRGSCPAASATRVHRTRHPDHRHARTAT